MTLNSVVNGLYLSDLQSASDVSLLAEAGITHVLSLGCEVQGELGAFNSSKLEFLAFPSVLDTTDERIIRIFDECLTFLSQVLKEPRSGNKKVLVHCVYGQSRSATIVAAFLMTAGFEFDYALDYLKRKCPNISINPSFLSQLHLYYYRRVFLAEYRLMMGEHGPKCNTTPCSVPNKSPTFVIHCASCNQNLLHHRYPPSWSPLPPSSLSSSSSSSPTSSPPSPPPTTTSTITNPTTVYHHQDLSAEFMRIIDEQLECATRDLFFESWTPEDESRSIFFLFCPIIVFSYLYQFPLYMTDFCAKAEVLQHLF